MNCKSLPHFDPRTCTPFPSELLVMLFFGSHLGVKSREITNEVSFYIAIIFGKYSILID